MGYAVEKLTDQIVALAKTNPELKIEQLPTAWALLDMKEFKLGDPCPSIALITAALRQAQKKLEELAAVPGPRRRILIE